MKSSNSPRKAGPRRTPSRTHRPFVPRLDRAILEDRCLMTAQFYGPASGDQAGIAAYGPTTATKINTGASPPVDVVVSTPGGSPSATAATNGSGGANGNSFTTNGSAAANVDVPVVGGHSPTAGVKQIIQNQATLTGTAQQGIQSGGNTASGQSQGGATAAYGFTVMDPDHPGIPVIGGTVGFTCSVSVDPTTTPGPAMTTTFGFTITTNYHVITFAPGVGITVDGSTALGDPNFMNGNHPDYSWTGQIPDAMLAPGGNFLMFNATYGLGIPTGSTANTSAQPFHNALTVNYSETIKSSILATPPPIPNPPDPPNPPPTPPTTTPSPTPTGPPTFTSIGSGPFAGKISAGQGITSPNGQYVLVMQSDGNLVEYGPTGTAIFASLTSGSGNYAVMQGDGNLVVYDSNNNYLWQSITSNSPNASLQLSNAGYLTINQAGSNARIWTGNYMLIVNQTLTSSGPNIVSPNGQYVLAMQGDGNLVEYDANGQVVFTSRTTGSGNFAGLKRDGTLAVFDSSGQPIWMSNIRTSQLPLFLLNNSGYADVYQYQSSASTATFLWSANSYEQLGRKITAGGPQIISPDGRYALVMQGDGNLVEYGPNMQPIFASLTTGKGNYAQIQSNGNFVVADANDNILWQSGTTNVAGDIVELDTLGTLAVETPVYSAPGRAWTGTYQVLPGRTFNYMDKPLYSGIAGYSLFMQNDGNLVEESPSGAVVFNAGTQNKGSYAGMQSDGNFVVYDASGNPLWSTGTQGHSGAYLMVNASGKLTVMYKGNVIWTT